MQQPWDTKAAGPYSIIAEHLQQVSVSVAEQLTSSQPSITSLLQEINRPGKMVRPALVLLSTKCFSPVRAEHLNIATIIEMIHIATLLHDDVLDHARTRRGRPTANALYGNEKAVLLGDLVLSRVFALCAEIADTRIRTCLARAAGRICEGELLQSLESGNQQLTEERYIEIIAAKSGEFFSTCCRLGGLAGGAGERYVDALAEFGLNAGIAFQITDDILDIVGRERQTGKTLGTDLVAGKLTLPVIHFLATEPEARKRELINLLGTGCEPDIDKGAALAELLQSSACITRARNEAEAYCNRALAALDGLGESEPRGALAQTAKFLISRSN